MYFYYFFIYRCPKYFLYSFLLFVLYVFKINIHWGVFSASLRVWCVHEHRYSQMLSPLRPHQRLVSSERAEVHPSTPFDSIHLKPRCVPLVKSAHIYPRSQTTPHRDVIVEQRARI